MTPSRRAAVFMDRDGTLMKDVGYPRAASDVHLLDGVGDALGALSAQGLALVVVSNQSGPGRGIITPEQARTVHERFVGELRLRSVELDAVEYWPHAPGEDCACRKPRPEMLLRAARRVGVDLAPSFMIGDRPSDVEAGRRAGCATILLSADEDRQGADHRASNWSEVLDVIRVARRARA